MTKEEVFQAVCWVTTKSYTEKQIALSHKAKIRIMPQRVKVRAVHAPPSGLTLQSSSELAACRKKEGKAQGPKTAMFIGAVVPFEGSVVACPRFRRLHGQPGSCHGLRSVGPRGPGSGGAQPWGPLHEEPRLPGMGPDLRTHRDHRLG